MSIGLKLIYMYSIYQKYNKTVFYVRISSAIRDYYWCLACLKHIKSFIDSALLNRQRTVSQSLKVTHSLTPIHSNVNINSH
jgi:hypothetical protein